MFRPETLPTDRPFADELAGRLLDAHGDALPRVLVLLPSVRAARGLRHAILEVSGRDAVLLPEVATPGQALAELAGRMGLDLAPFPDAMRAEWLAHDLAREPWLAERPEAASGLAAELVGLFDEMRRHDLDPADPGSGLDDALLLEDAERVTAAWSLYRRRIARDAVDAEMAAVRALADAEPWPGRPLDAVWAAGFVAMPPVRARLLHLLAAHAGDARLVAHAPVGTDGSFAGTYADPTGPTHPDAPLRHLCDRLDLEPSPVAVASSAPVIEFAPAAAEEDESRRIAAQVVERLREAPGSRICVASGDRNLARRVVAQLRDAGLDLDDSGGVPLSSTPAGRLAWLLLRCAVTGPAHEPLLELLAHPLLRCGRPRRLQRRRALTFERELLRGRTPPADLDGYRDRARDRDAAMHERLPDSRPDMTELVDDLARTLAPLTALADGGARPLDAVAAALREAVLHAVTAGDDEGSGTAPPTADAIILDRVLDLLESAAPTGPSFRLVDAAALYARLAAGAEVRPHRSEFLPVQVTGLLEARLERYDLLILGGLSEDVFPGRLPRPLFLGRAWRDAVGLPDWRETMGRQAELFQRLLDVGDRVVLSWPSERDGRPVLASPFVQRLLLDVDDRPEPGPTPPLYRRAAASDASVLPASRLASPAEAPTALAALRTVRHLSPSAIATYLACPYRWLLEKGCGLVEEDDVREALESRDQGTIVHECLAAWLAPDGPGTRALAEGRIDDARDALHVIAAERFAHRAGGLPQRPLWEASFRRLVDEIVAFEGGRIATWRPAAVEADFSLPLGELAAWAGDASELSDAEAAVPLKGRIDRVDVRRDGDQGVLVLDYKTGRRPSAKDVVEGRDLQLATYALALVLGGAPGVSADVERMGGQFHLLKPGEVGFKDGKTIALTPEMLQRDACTILAAARAMLRADGPFPLAPGFEGVEDPDPCRYCHLDGVCRRDERLALARGEAAS